MTSCKNICANWSDWNGEQIEAYALAYKRDRLLSQHLGAPIVTIPELPPVRTLEDLQKENLLFDIHLFQRNTQ
jgi:hypothetical protein